MASQLQSMGSLTRDCAVASRSIGPNWVSGLLSPVPPIFVRRSAVT